MDRSETGFSSLSNALEALRAPGYAYNGCQLLALIESGFSEINKANPLRAITRGMAGSEAGLSERPRQDRDADRMIDSCAAGLAGGEI
jgi:hypothetical protein